MKAWILGIIAVLLAGGTLYFTSCERLEPPERARVDAWLLCEDCSDGELDSVLALGARKPRATVDTLGSDLRHGPRGNRWQNLKRQFNATYAADSTFARVRRGLPSYPITRSHFIALESTVTVQLYRSRAARALQSIGGSRARTALAAVRLDTLNTGDSIAVAPVP